MNTEYTYSTLINKVIEDFDSIFGSLVTKKVEYAKDTPLTVADHRDSGLVATGDYASFINSQLFKIAGLTSTELGGAGTVISNYSGRAQVGANPTITADAEEANAYVISLKVPNSGYYSSGDNASSLTYTLSTTSFEANATSLAGLLADGVYTKTVDLTKGGTLISSVSIAQGSVTVANKELASGDASGYTYDASNMVYNVELTPTSSAAVFEYSSTANGGPANKDDYVAIELGSKIKTSGTLSVSAKAHVEEGYVKDGDVTLNTFTKTWATGSTLVENGGSSTIYIPKGTIELAEDALEGVTTGITSSQVTLVDDAKEGYLISATVAKGDETEISLKGTVTEGYVKKKAGEDDTVDLGSITLGTANKYVKAGSIAASTAIIPTKDAQNKDVEVIRYTDTGTVTSTTEKSTAGLDNYAVAVSAVGEANIAITEGYIKGVTAKATVDQSKTIYVTHGQYNVNPTATVSVSSMTASDDGNYVITATPVIAALSTAGLSEGYIKSGDVKIGTKTETPTSISIAKGEAAVKNTISVTFHDVVKENGNTETSQVVDLFVDDLADIEGRDYYAITSGAEYDGTFKAGWINSSSEIGLGNVLTRYIPKADLTISEDENGELVVNVESAGYLPSGLLSATDLTESTISNAVFTVIAGDDSSSIFSTTAIEGGYELNIAKGTFTKAGYISANSGTINGKFYVAAGAVDVETSVGTITAGEATKAEGSTKYTIAVSGKATTTISGLPTNGGYVTAQDISLNGAVYTATNNANQLDIDKTIEIETATLKVAEQSLKINLEVEKATGLETVDPDEGGFKISPKIAANSEISITALSAGYISGEDTQKLTIADSSNLGTDNDIYIKAGTGVTITPVETVGLANTLTASVNTGDSLAQGTNYTISVSGTVDVKGTIGTGYYDSTMTTLDQQVTVNGTTPVSLKHGKVESAVDAKTGISAVKGATGVTGGENRQVKFLEEGTSSETPYVTIEANVVQITNSVTVTEGYIKNDATDKKVATALTSPEAAKSTAKIKAVNLTTEGTGTDTVYKVVAGQESELDLSEAEYTGKVVAETEEAYSSYKTKVVLSEHAMGSAVLTQMRNLSSRLNGNLVRNPVVQG